MKAENQKLKEGIHVLQERNNNLSYVNEKLSLITAMKLFQKDHENKFTEQMAEVNSYSWSTVKRTKANTDIIFQSQNKYEVLKIEDDEAVQINNDLMRRRHGDSHEVLEYNDELITKNRKKIHEGVESQINHPNLSNSIK